MVYQLLQGSSQRTLITSDTASPSYSDVIDLSWPIKSNHWHEPGLSSTLPVCSVLDPYLTRAFLMAYQQHSMKVEVRYVKIPRLL
jgi:hypothetical protein